MAFLYMYVVASTRPLKLYEEKWSDLEIAQILANYGKQDGITT